MTEPSKSGAVAPIKMWAVVRDDGELLEVYRLKEVALTFASIDRQPFMDTTRCTVKPCEVRII